MSQISRPFQIALLTMGLFVAVWFVALRGHSSATSGEASPAPAPTTAPAAPSGGPQGAKAAAPSSAYQGSAPGVAGLTRAIAKAHGAVEASQQNAQQLKEKSAQASGSAATAGSSAEGTASPRSAARAGTATTPVTPAHPRGSAGKRIAPSSKVPAKQLQVERALKQGAVAVVLFWSPKGSDDVAVRRELQLLKEVHERVRSVARVPAVSRLLKAVGLELGRKIAVQEASASQVAAFGSITRSVRVTSTPTLLIINKHGQTTTLTGLTDAYSIEQAIDEARKA
jgi:hypothetical protein